MRMEDYLSGSYTHILQRDIFANMIIIHLGMSVYVLVVREKW